MLPCIVRETSPFGLLVETTEVRAIPDRFHLLLEGTRLVACHAIRRSLNSLGVEFDEPVAALGW
jgi:hypothetical protein